MALHSNMNTISYPEIILEFISLMDIERLKFYLKDRYTYQDTTKDVFLNELEKIFQEHKNSGDTQLLRYTGNCFEKACSVGCSGYRFVGNKSRDYFDLIFKVEENDIKDIYSCSVFRTIEKLNDLQAESTLDINTDDKVSFNKTPEYWSKVNTAIAAYEEIITDQPTILNYGDLCYWLDRHEFTIKNIADGDFINSRMKWGAFTNLYQTLNDIRKYIVLYHEKFYEALKAYKEIVDEKDLITWMLEHETMYAKVPYYSKYDITKGLAGYANKNIGMIIFNDSPIVEMFDFIVTYQKHHLDILNKYGIYTLDEISQVVTQPEYDYSLNLAYSLKFHLEKRMEAAELGILIPFHLNGFKNT